MKSDMVGKRWTKKEVAILREKYPKQGSEIPKLDRTQGAIKKKAQSLGLSAPQYWTEEELSILKEKYPEQGSDIPELDRTRSAIKNKAQRLGLSAPYKPSTRWTEKELSLLKKKYPKQGTDIPELDRTKRAIIGKAYELGISYDRKNHITVTNALQEYLEGLLLGDGCIASRKNGSAHYIHSDSDKEYLIWLKNKLESLGLPCSNKIYKNSPTTGFPSARPTSIFYLDSMCTAELETIYEKWYPDGKKQIPDDLEITPTILKNWYIGDGWFSNGRLAITCSFDREGKQRLVSQINEQTPIEAHNTKEGVQIPRISHKVFFKYILSQEQEVPPEYEYKFDTSKIRESKRITKKEKKKIAKLAKKRDSYTYKEIAKEVGVSKASAYNYGKEYRK